MHTFAVSAVEPGTQVITREPLKANLEAFTRAPVEACHSNLVGLSTAVANPFVQAALEAFASHLPLTLSPDDVWLCIAQGFGTHVRLNAEALRSRFVAHEGKLELVVIRDDFIKGSPGNDWPGVFAEVSERIAAHIGKKRDLVVADFSTTGPAERAASEVVLVGAMNAYFDVTVLTMCGIPSITLLGTPADWRSIRDRARVLGEFDLQSWVRDLEPVLDQFVAAAEGTVDTAFWQSFVKRHSGSGGPYLTGWINVLFPYLEAGFGGGPKANRFMSTWATAVEGAWSVNGSALHEFPAGYTATPFTWLYLEEKLPMDFLGGFVGVSQDEHTLALRPAIGWAVRRTPTLAPK